MIGPDRATPDAEVDGRREGPS